MNPKDEIQRLKSDLEALQSGGQRVVPIEALKKYLVELGLEPGPSNEEKQLELQRSLAQYNATNELNLELFRSGDDAGKEALRASLLVNGGAVVAILGFLGAVVNKGTVSNLGLALAQPLLAFGAGVLLSALAFGARYLTSYAYGLQRNDWAKWSNVLAICLALLAYSGFSCGIYSAYLAFRAYFSGVL